jgi:tetratricopeptide (TPR) repeat protein
MNLRFFLQVVFIFLTSCGVVFGAPEVAASLSSSTISVGESVDLEVTVGGTARANDPEIPQIEGLEFVGAGQSSQTVFNNGNVTQRISFNYRFVARKEGTFTIPPITVSVGGEKAETKALTVTVKPGAPAKAAGDIAFAKIELLKNKAFVGEDLGVEIRAYLDAGTNWRNVDKPQLTAEGFNSREIKPGRQGQIELDGKQYHTVIYRTVVTPTKAGKLKLGEMKLKVVYSKSQSNRYDPFGRMLGRAEEMELVAPAVELDVRPLPSEGRPSTFAGAIGKFTKFHGSGSPSKVKIGEPVAMVLVVEGQGNFDRITVPPLDEPDGWTAYDSEDSFEAADDLGITGRKTFKLPVSPSQIKTTLPVFAFTFFNPETVKYVTLKNDASALLVEGSPLNNPPAVASLPDAAVPPAEQAKPDLLPNLSMPGAVVSFRQGISPSMYFAAVLAPLPLLIFVAYWRTRKADPLAAELKSLAAERSRLCSKLRHADDRAELYAAFGRILQIDTASARREPGLAFDDETVLSTRELDESSREKLKALLANRSELLFAGAGQGEKVENVERDRVMEVLAAWEKSRVGRAPHRVSASVGLMLLAFAGAAHAGDFDVANKAFADGKFEDARRGFERSLSDGWKVGVLFNLGNAHFRLGQSGKAALNFERALALSPGQPEVSANLKFVRESAGAKYPSPSWMEAVFSLVPPRIAPWLAIGVAWIGWLWAGSAVVRRTGAAGVAGGAMLVVLGTVYGIGAFWNVELRQRDAVVLLKSDARREPSDRGVLAEELGEGSKIRIISEQGEWSYVALPGGEKGWIKSSAFERIIPLAHQ